LELVTLAYALAEPLEGEPPLETEYTFTTDGTEDSTSV
jgi:hypothetical protein